MAHKVAPGHDDYWPRTHDDHVAHAEALMSRAEAEPEERAQLLAGAAGSFRIAERPERADQAYQASIADGGPVAGDVRAFYASFLFAAGRADDGYAVLEAARKAGVEDWLGYLAIADALRGHGDFTAALRWLTRGLVAQYGSVAEIDLDALVLDEDGYTLAVSRRSIRAEAGLDPDVLDRLVEEAAAELADIE